MTHGLDLDDLPLVLDGDILKDPEVLDPQLPIGELALAQALPISRLGRGLVAQLLINGVEDDALFKFPIGAHMFGSGPRECDFERLVASTLPISRLLPLLSIRNQEEHQQWMS
jgi:hypothetical protein